MNWRARAAAALCMLAGLPGPPALAGDPAYPPVVAGRALSFPADYGSHPEFRTEWWYVTGWLATADGAPLGFQITFFRTRPAIDERNPSAFSPHQLLIAHCVISDPAVGRLTQDQRIRREAFGLAGAEPGDTDVHIDRWSLKRTGTIYAAAIDAEDFALRLQMQITQPPLLNGAAGFSRKGPEPQSASYYYSIPHLKVTGEVTRNGKPASVTGEAWFDHEWSSQYLDPLSVGWDWIGINLDDGGALMAFRIRGPDGQPHWAGGTYRNAAGVQQVLGPQDVQFAATRQWISPRTAIAYPVAWNVRAGDRELRLEPLLDDQENDTRLSTGAIYWEGAVRALDSHGVIGRGYLELTGYGDPLRLR